MKLTQLQKETMLLEIPLSEFFDAATLPPRILTFFTVSSSVHEKKKKNQAKKLNKQLKCHTLINKN